MSDLVVQQGFLIESARRFLVWVAAAVTPVARRMVRRVGAGPRDRGDVPGWVLVTIMTAGLVVALWAIAGKRLGELFSNALDQVAGGPK